MFNPGKISVKESSEKDSAIVNMDLEEYDEEIPPIELERIQTTDDHFDKEDNTQCSKIRKKSAISKVKKTLFAISKMAKNQFLHKKKV